MTKQEQKITITKENHVRIKNSFLKIINKFEIYHGWFLPVLIEGVLFRAQYLGSTQLVSEGQPSKATRLMQAQEAINRIKVIFAAFANLSQIKIIIINVHNE